MSSKQRTSREEVFIHLSSPPGQEELQKAAGGGKRKNCSNRDISTSWSSSWFRGS